MISLVIPCFNESEVLELTFVKLADASRLWGDVVEMIFVDDGSTDGTWTIIQSLARRDPRVRGVRLTRNFGHQAAVGAGLERIQGDAVVVLDADLQDPPSLVSEMLVHWRKGFEIVYAQRRRRHGESWFKRLSASAFYRLLDRLNTVAIPRDVGDFALMDARVARTLASLPEHGLFWRGLRAWSGYRQTAVYFDRPSRAAGKTKYTLAKMLRLGSNGLLSFSELPLRLPLYLGAGTLAVCAIAVAWSLAAELLDAAAIRTVPSTLLGLFFLGGVQLLCLGVMGEYLNRIYEEVRNRPRWIVDVEVGVESGMNSKAA